MDKHLLTWIQKPTISNLASDDKIPFRLKLLINKYDKLFHGVGKINNGKVHLLINKDVTPVVQSTKKFPLPFVRTWRVTRPETTGHHRACKRTSIWVSPIVAFPKTDDPHKIQLCVDMRQPNDAMQREQHPQATIDDLINDLNGARHFNKLDLASAYHQLELDEESRYTTTFTTHTGPYQSKRSSFGSSSASEIFSKRTSNCIQRHVEISVMTSSFLEQL